MGMRRGRKRGLQEREELSSRKGVRRLGFADTIHDATKEQRKLAGKNSPVDVARIKKSHRLLSCQERPPEDSAIIIISLKKPGSPAA